MMIQGVVGSTPAVSAGDVGETTTSTAVTLDTQRIEEQNLAEA